MMDLDVKLVLGDKTYFLSPTLDAMKKINRQFSSIVDASIRVARYDFEAIAFIIAAGAGLSEKQSQKMEQELVAAGLVVAAPLVAEYIAVLLNPTGKTEESSEQGEG